MIRKTAVDDLVGIYPGDRSPSKEKMRSSAGHEVGAANWALLTSIVATCKLNDVNPLAYIAETLDAILNGHPQGRIEEWRFRKTSSPAECGT